MRFSVYQESHIGGRKSNQDRMGYSYTREAALLLLADGMGGHIQGEVAATIALQTMGALFQECAKPYVRRPERFLEDGFFAAHREIQRYRAVNNLPETPRTTIVACLIQHGNALWAHCGDSRLYWIRAGRILDKTKDHSRIEMLIAQGKVDASERDTHPDRNKLFNCLGAPTLPAVEVSRPASLLPGDLLLLCSDGLWSMVPDPALVQELQGNGIARAVPALIRAAAANGGSRSDNVTALALHWESPDPMHEKDTISTLLLPPDAVTTNIQPLPGVGLDNADQDALYDDQAIQNAIDQIRQALDKTSDLTPKK